MKAEFEEQQKKSTMGNMAGGGNPLQGFVSDSFYPIGL